MLVGAGDVPLQQKQNKTDKTPNKATSGEGGPSVLSMVLIQRQKNPNKIIQVPLQNNQVPDQNKRGRNRSS